MPEETKRKRGRPPKNKPEPVVEINTEEKLPVENSYENNSYTSSISYGKSISVTTGGLINSIFSCGVYDFFDAKTIDCVLKNPILFHEEAIKLSEFVYSKNGAVSNSIDYMTALPCLDRIITSKKKSKKAKANKERRKSTLKTIDDKRFVRDAIFTEMLDGIAFYYFETKKHSLGNSKFMTDYEVDSIVEINELGINASIITLPWQYTKIVGKRNGRYVIAFNLEYFNDFTGEKLERKLKKYPVEIVEAFRKKEKNPNEVTGNWVVLNNDKTMCRKIKCKDSDPWGRSLIIAALEDVLYKDYFVDTKRNVLDEINNKIIYETFPEGQQKGSCALTKKQQESQHNTVKSAVTNKNNRGGISFFSVAAGTKIDSIDVDVDIFDSKNESDLTNTISQDLGVCASLIGAMTTGNYASAQLNLEMLTAQLYTWVYEWQNELNHVINKNIIQDEKNPVEVYYFPTSFVNRKSFFEMMKTLYTDASGSLSFLIASAGVDVDTYLTVLDDEIDRGLFQKYLPHMTSYTTNNETISKVKEKGRPITDNPSDNTVKNNQNGGNTLPSPSDNK